MPNIFLTISAILKIFIITFALNFSWLFLSYLFIIPSWILGCIFAVLATKKFRSNCRINWLGFLGVLIVYFASINLVIAVFVDSQTERTYLAQWEIKGMNEDYKRSEVIFTIEQFPQSKLKLASDQIADFLVKNKKDKVSLKFHFTSDFLQYRTFGLDYVDALAVNWSVTNYSSGIDTDLELALRPWYFW